MQSPHPFDPAAWRRRLSAGLAGLALFSACAGAASAQPAESPVLAPSADDALRTASIDDLKRVYLQCNDAALGGRLGWPGVMGCSVIYETLKQRAFGGDFDRLLAWSREQAAAREAAR